MGMNVFAPYRKRNTSFIVKNIITNSNKTVKIFHYPIPIGAVRDLLGIPGISESDIRASLLKGEILHKILAKEITVIESDIDLLQFNTAQKLFLQKAGVINGLEVTDSQVQSSKLRELISFIDEGVETGGYKETTSYPFPTNITWYTDNTKSKKVVEKLMTYYGNNLPFIITWNIYNDDGITISNVIIDTIVYQSNSFEFTKTRVIA